MRYFPDLKIISKAREIYNSVVGNKSAQSARQNGRITTFIIPQVASDPNAQQLINQPSDQRITRRQMEADPGAIGSADPSPWQFNLTRDYIRPQQNYRYDIAADVAIAINPQLRAALRNIAYGAAGTFQGIKILNAPRIKRVQECVDSLVERTKLKLYLAEYVFRYLLYGRQYLQHELFKLNGKTVIKSLLYMPTYGMIRCSNDLNQFDDIDHAYEQEDISRGVYRNGGNIGEFPEWSINNLLYRAVPGEPYGHSIIESTIYSGANERYIDAMCELYWQHKYSRPLDIHSLKGPEGMPAGKTQIEDHLKAVSKLRALQAGQQPPRDIVVPDGTVTRLPGDPNTDKVAGLQMMCAQMLSELWQSSGMMSDDEFANVGVLQERFRHLFGAEETIMISYCEQFSDTVKFELALNGFDPESIEYDFVTAQRYLIQDLILINTEARNDRKEKQIPRDTRLNIAAQLYRDDPSRMQKMLDKEEEEDKQKMIDQQNQLLLAGAGNNVEPNAPSIVPVDSNSNGNGKTNGQPVIKKSNPPAQPVISSDSDSDSSYKN